MGRVFIQEPPLILGEHLLLLEVLEENLFLRDVLPILGEQLLVINFKSSVIRETYQSKNKKNWKSLKVILLKSTVR